MFICVNFNMTMIYLVFSLYSIYQNILINIIYQIIFIEEQIYIHKDIQILFLNKVRASENKVRASGSNNGNPFQWNASYYYD